MQSFPALVVLSSRVEVLEGPCSKGVASRKMGSRSKPRLSAESAIINGHVIERVGAWEWYC